MNWLRKWNTLPQEVLNRIRMANTPDELDATAKRK